MTALDQYQRLEALALWRADATADPREVIATFGNARLTLMDMEEAPITQWSLAALRKSVEPDPAGRGDVLALTPDPDGAECLWLDDSDMIAAISTVWVEDEVETKPQPSGSRIFRTVILAVLALALIVGAIMARDWTRTTLIAQVPEEVWRQLSDDMVEDLTAEAEIRLCRRSRGTDPALASLRTRLGSDQASIMPVLFNGNGAQAPVISLPDGRALIDSTSIRIVNQPEALAGLMALALARQEQRTARAWLARDLSFPALIGLVVKGELSESGRATAARTLFALPATEAQTDAQAVRMLEIAGLPSAPLALILSGRNVPIERLEAIAEGDTIGSEPFTPALPDQDWLALRNRCG